MPETIEISRVIVTESRHRKQFIDIDKLAESIRAIGLIHPIVVERATGRLLAGERRLRACKLLDMTHIPVTYRDELSEWDAQTIELEENIKRAQLTWQEEIAAKLQLHELYISRYGQRKKGRGAIDGGHRVIDTANLLGESEGEVIQDLALARAIRDRPELGLASKDCKSAAFRALKATEEFSLREQIAAVLAEDDSPTTSMPSGYGSANDAIRLIHGDALTEIRKLDSDSIDFCITDPPYQIDIDNNRRMFYSSKWAETRVDGDIKDIDWQADIFKELYRVLRPGAHLYTFFSFVWHRKMAEILWQAGFTVRYIPIIWRKTRSSNLTPYSTYSNAHEPILFAHKGPARQFRVPGMEDWIDWPTPHNKLHPTEKPAGLLRALIHNCSVRNETGIDCFAGSGTMGVACKQLNRRAILIEKDSEYYTRCWERMETAKVEEEEEDA